MNALAILYGGDLHSQVLEEVFPGKSALTSALERAAAFPGVAKAALLLGEAGTLGLDEGALNAAIPPGVLIQRQSRWTKRTLLEALAALGEGFDLTYYAWADCPLLDPVLTEALMARHGRFAAEYSYADGWPYGFAPELLAPGVAGILGKVLGDDDGPVERDAIFSVLQKDINAFDIEAEISPVDLRPHRISLSADSRRNLLLLRALAGAGLSGADGAAGIIAEKPELLRTLPNFYAIQTARPCPKSCPLCPYPSLMEKRGGQDGFMDGERFAALLDKIEAFSGDAVIDISLWGEIALHPQKLELIRMVLDRPALSLIVETVGLGWKREELETLAALTVKPRLNRMAPLSWIVSGEDAPAETAKTLMDLFPKDAYIQALRVQGGEDETERFYRSWKEAGANVIIQKYDDFCGYLPKKQAADLSPVKRRPCWHLMRDMNILLDGTVPLCREDLAVLAGTGASLGNAFDDPFDLIWAKGGQTYREHCAGQYPGLCGSCDEYYTFNF